MRRLPFASLVVVLALAGCDRGPADFTGSDIPGDEAVASGGLYIKGPAALRLGAPLEYRTNSVAGAAGYSWSATGAGSATIDTRGNSRLVAATGQQAGPITLTVYAYDADEVVFAQGSRSFVVE